ncbi:DNA methyltransferase [Candidatus Spongiihabitans sp.]|uniref:DNA methyltransferase n=1 Tax=Candidatus Spongiihabitans sp. TaxID=3101308 RepID=UPI003C6EF6BD
MNQQTKIVRDDCLRWLHNTDEQINLTFFDPPFNQGRFYRHYDDNQEEDSYWEWITNVLSALRAKTQKGGAVYFMHREKIRSLFWLRCDAAVGHSKTLSFGKRWHQQCRVKIDLENIIKSLCKPQTE